MHGRRRAVTRSPRDDDEHPRPARSRPHASGDMTTSVFRRLGSLALCLLAVAAAPMDPRSAPGPDWDLELAPKKEPGDRFEMSGIVRDTKGEPAGNATVFVYHADA